MIGVPLAPPSASTFAGETDTLFYLFVGFSFALGTFLTVLVVGYAIKYRRGSKARRTGRRARNLTLEIGWTTASVVIAFIFFLWGADLYAERTHPPANAIHIIGVAKQWMWKFQHPEGVREINALHVPRGRSVVVELASQDVIHSFFVPAFRVKQDVVPGMSTSVWFDADQVGTFHLFCAEFCGTEHSEMQGQLVVMTPEDYAAWLEKQPQGDSTVAEGEALFRSLGCSGCHDNGTVRAPSLVDLYGHPVALANSSTVVADERYIRDSILQPNKEVVAGFAPIMPSFAGVIDESETLALIAYVRSLSTAAEGS